jgi:ectoine hydroxylase
MQQSEPMHRAADAYPSRVGGAAELRDRLDPVLHGRAHGALTEAQRRQYEREGYLFFPDLLSGTEVTALCAELEALARDPRVRASERVIYEADSDVVRSIFAVHEQSRRVERVTRHCRILSMVTELLDSDVYVHQSRINFKPGFDGREFYWHSDFETWHVEDGMPRMRALSLSINLSENTPLNGPLMLIPGSHHHYVCCAGLTPPEHHKQSLRKQEYGVPTQELLGRLVERGGIAAPTGPAGSAVLFECNMLHGSNGNITPWPRSNLFIVFNSTENSLVEPFAGLPPRPAHIANRCFLPLCPL